jgi:DNA polymerase-3 subunit alpha
MEHSRFVHLHCHTQYSLLDGANKVEELVERVKALKQPALAMTDHGNMFGAIEFYLEASKRGVKPIVAAKSMSRRPAASSAKASIRATRNTTTTDSPRNESRGV